MREIDADYRKTSNRVGVIGGLMREVVLTRYGPNAAVLASRPITSTAPGNGQVRVRVGAFALNPVDIKVQRGEPQMILPFRPPFVPGVDFAGTIDAVGSDVTNHSVGDRVFGYLGMDRMGAFAQMANVPADRLARTPLNLDDAEASTVPLPALTAVQALRASSVGSGARLIVLGTGGAVGRSVIQLAASRGVEVIGMASARSLDQARQDGAAHVFEYGVEAMPTVVRDVDAVIDTVGGSVIESTWRMMRRGAKLVSLHIPPDPATIRRAGLVAGILVRIVMPLVSYRARHSAARADVTVVPLLALPSVPDLEEVTRHIEGGTLRPPTATTFAFDDYRDAYEAMATRMRATAVGRGSSGLSKPPYSRIVVLGR